MAKSRELRDELLKEDDSQENTRTQPLNDLQLQFDEAEQQKIVDIVIQDFESAVQAREQREWSGDIGLGLTWDEKYGELMRLYEDQKVARPEKWMANRSLRIAMAIVEMMFAKLFPAVWNKDALKWRPVEFTDAERSERISKFMKWVTEVQMKASKIIKPAVKYAIKFGNSIVKDKWVVDLRDKGETEEIPIQDEAGQPVLGPDGQPQTVSQGILSRKEYADGELVPLDRFYIQPGQTDLQKEPVIQRISYFYRDLELMEMQGKVQNVQNFLKVNVDSMILSEMEETLEEAEKISKVDVKRRAYPLEILEWYGPYDANGDGFPEECVFMVDKRTRTYLSGMPLNKISRRAKRPFSKLGFIERENAFYWIGVLEQVKSLAQELDACMNQLIDANTLSIMRWGFYDPTGDYEPETHVAKPRSMYPVRNPQQSVYFPEYQIPIERLLNAIRLVLEFIERLTAASSYVMGKESEIVGGSGTATRTQAIVSAANERYAIPADALKEGIAEFLTNILCQYQMNIPPGLESRVLGEKGEQIFKDGELTKESLDAELDAYLATSASMGDKNAEMEIASWIYSNLLVNPLVAPSMERVYKVTERMLKAMGEEAEYYLGQKPYSKPSDNPEDEHTMIREGLEVHPMPQEQHIYHLMQHTQKLQDPELLLWPEEAIVLLNGHIQETQNMMAQIMQMLSQKGTKGGAKPGTEEGGSGGPNSVQSEPGKGISQSGSVDPLANQTAGVASSAQGPQK